MRENFLHWTQHRNRQGKKNTQKNIQLIGKVIIFVESNQHLVKSRANSDWWVAWASCWCKCTAEKFDISVIIETIQIDHKKSQQMKKIHILQVSSDKFKVILPNMLHVDAFGELKYLAILWMVSEIRSILWAENFYDIFDIFSPPRSAVHVVCLCHRRIKIVRRRKCSTVNNKIDST